jgi:hypothetical protein
MIQAKVRSNRFGKTAKRWRSRGLTISIVQHPAARPLISGVGKDAFDEGKAPPRLPQQIARPVAPC